MGRVQLGGQPFGLSSNWANFISFESGNWASAMSDLPRYGRWRSDCRPTGRRVVTAATRRAGAAGAADVSRLAGDRRAAWAACRWRGLGQATLVGYSVGAAELGRPLAPVASTASRPHRTDRGLDRRAHRRPAGHGARHARHGAAGRNGSGFGAPRYGVKPIVMPKPTAV